MPRLLFSKLFLAFFFAISIAAGIEKTCAQEPYSVGWAWSAKEVETAGDAFWPQFRGPTGDGNAKFGLRIFGLRLQPRETTKRMKHDLLDLDAFSPTHQGM